MRGKRVKSLRSGNNPKPGRKNRGINRKLAEHSYDGPRIVSTNKYFTKKVDE